MNFSSLLEEENGLDEINLTPLIDIVFLLLIFFVLTTTFIDTKTLDLKLPKASSAEIGEKKKSITVSINSSGEIYLDDKQLSQNKLLNTFREEKLKSNQIKLVIKADESTNHGKVVEVMDSARQSGISSISIAAVSR